MYIITPPNYNTPELRALWEAELVRIRQVEAEMQHFRENLTELGISMASKCTAGRRIGYPTMHVFGTDSKYKLIDDFVHVSNLLDHAKQMSDNHVRDLNKLIYKQACEDAIDGRILAQTAPRQTIYEIIAQWVEYVIGGYYNIARKYMQLPSHVFVEDVSTKTFQETFASLHTWELLYEGVFNYTGLSNPATVIKPSLLRARKPRKRETYWCYENGVRCDAVQKKKRKTYAMLKKRG